MVSQFDFMAQTVARPSFTLGLPFCWVYRANKSWQSLGMLSCGTQKALDMTHGESSCVVLLGWSRSGGFGGGVRTLDGRVEGGARRKTGDSLNGLELEPRRNSTTVLFPSTHAGRLS